MVLLWHDITFTMLHTLYTIKTRIEPISLLTLHMYHHHVLLILFVSVAALLLTTARGDEPCIVVSTEWLDARLYEHRPNSKQPVEFYNDNVRACKALGHSCQDWYYFSAQTGGVQCLYRHAQDGHSDQMDDITPTALRDDRRIISAMQMIKNDGDIVTAIKNSATANPPPNAPAVLSFDGTSSIYNPSKPRFTDNYMEIEDPTLRNACKHAMHTGVHCRMVPTTKRLDYERTKQHQAKEANRNMSTTVSRKKLAARNIYDMFTWECVGNPQWIKIHGEHPICPHVLSRSDTIRQSTPCLTLSECYVVVDVTASHYDDSRQAIFMYGGVMIASITILTAIGMRHCGYSKPRLLLPQAKKAADNKSKRKLDMHTKSASTPQHIHNSNNGETNVTNNAFIVAQFRALAKNNRKGTPSTQDEHKIDWDAELRNFEKRHQHVTDNH